MPPAGKGDYCTRDSVWGGALLDSMLILWDHALVSNKNQISVFFNPKVKEN